jgi:DNA-binding CsgD family transcriptional regulator
MTELCPTCGQVKPPAGLAASLTPGELDALSAWWHMGTVKRAADLLSRSERTVINQLYSARNRNRVHTTVELVQLYLGSLRSVSELIMQHNESRTEATHRIRKAA